MYLRQILKYAKNFDEIDSLRIGYVKMHINKIKNLWSGEKSRKTMQKSKT